MRFNYVAAGLLLTLGSPAALFAQGNASDGAGNTANLPVTRVTLYTSGVGYFERRGDVDGDASKTLLFPVGQVNDILKSLILLDTGGGQIQPVTYAAQDPLGRQLQAFSIDLSDNPDRVTLLNRLRGANAAITISGASGGSGAAAPSSLTGEIVGVEQQTVVLPNNAGTTQQATLNLLAEDGLHSIPLAQITGLQLTDPKLNQELRQALSAVSQSRDAAKRGVKLNFSGRGRRKVMVGYLTEAPLWQTTYRLVLGKSPILQGWALVQNTTQDDWSNIDLSLVSGRPISFIQDLYTPLYVPRPMVAARVQASPTPQTYNADLNGNNAPVPAAPPITVQSSAPSEYEARDEKAMAKTLPGFAGGRGGGGAGIKFYALPQNLTSWLKDGPSSQLEAADAVRHSLAAYGAQLGTALFSYQVKVPVNVPRQQSAMIPFISSAIQAETVSIYNAGVQTNHPLLGARVKNTSGLHLMGGPLTVFDETTGGGTGYVGDALVDDTEPNQTRLISYAVDLGVDAETKPGSGSGEIVSVIVSQGVLIATRKEEQSTVYTFKNNSGKQRTVVVEQPYPGDDWKLMEPKAVTEHTAQFDRFDLAVPAGASKSLTVRQQHPESERFGLLDTDLDSLVFYTRTGETSESVKAALKEVISRRQKVAQIQKEINNRNAQVQAISAGQQRIRDNMKALDHASALYKRYVGELNTQETKLGDLQTEIETLTRDRDQAQADLNNYVAHLNIS